MSVVLDASNSLDVPVVLSVAVVIVALALGVVVASVVICGGLDVVLVPIGAVVVAALRDHVRLG